MSNWNAWPPAVRAAVGVTGSVAVALLAWQLVLVPLRWPEPSLVVRYFAQSAVVPETYLALLMTGLRAVVAVVIGFGAAVVLSVLTGRTVVGWICFFFLLLALQKIPAVAMTHVFVQSRLGIGFTMTIVLAATVVTTFTWLVLHHRASMLNDREVFALRVIGFRGWRLALYGLLPHLGSAVGGAARLAMSIATIMVVLGEWQGVWADGSIWQYGLGVTISRAYDTIHSEARVLAGCLWLGVLGVLLDALVQLSLHVARSITGVNFKR